MFIGHGAFEHCEVYTKMASRLNDSKMLVFSHDHGTYVQRMNIAMDE